MLRFSTFLLGCFLLPVFAMPGGVALAAPAAPAHLAHLAPTATVLAGQVG